MPKIINASALVMCPHGGKVQIIPSQFTTTAGGSPVLVFGDLDGKPILGCTQPPTPTTAPCTATLPMLIGASLKVTVGGKPALLDTATGVTNGVPPGPWKVQAPGQEKVDATA